MSSLNVGMISTHRQNFLPIGLIFETLIGFNDKKRITKQLLKTKKGGAIELLVSKENVVEQLKLKNEEGISFVLQTYGGLLNAIIRRYLHGNQQDIEECLADLTDV
jgi:hypothetical protein